MSMLTIKRQLLVVFSFLFLIGAAVAQEEKIANLKESSVTASASGERVRFSTLFSVVQIRLEVYDSSGSKLFDNEVRGANFLDWNLQDTKAERISDGTYLCVVTIKALSGKLAQRLGSVHISDQQVTLVPAHPSKLTIQQSQAVGPMEEDSGVTVLKEDEVATTTVIAHNGDEGQIIRGKGALSFRIGDFFSGKDSEQMRLTSEGNLGIGLTNPQVRLDVDGLIRATQGIVFPDGSIQLSAARKTLGAASLRPGQSATKSP